MKLIKVHPIRDGETGAWLINVTTIELVRPSENGSVIFFLDDSSLPVAEGLDTIMRLVNETNT